MEDPHHGPHEAVQPALPARLLQKPGSLGEHTATTAGFSPFGVLGTFSTPGIQFIIEIFHPDNEKTLSK